MISPGPRGRPAPLAVLQVVSTGARVGVSGVVSLLARELRDRGFRSSVLALTDGPLAGEMAAAGIPAEVCAVDRAFDPGAILRVRRHLARARPDVVHTHGQRAMFAGNLAARLEGSRAVVTSFHEVSSVKAATTRLHRLYATAEGALARGFTHACIATSHVVLDDARRARRIPRRLLRLIQNAVDPSRFRPPAGAEERRRDRERFGIADGEWAIGTMGSLGPIKGQAYLIDALAAARVPEARLLIAGFGPLRAELEARARQRGVAGRVTFAGDVPDPERLHRALDLFVLPSLAESCPLVVLEAVASRTPVVASAVGDVAELLDQGAGGLLVPPGEPAALAAAIERAHADPAGRARAVDAAERRLRESFSAARFAEAHAALYRELAAR